MNAVCSHSISERLSKRLALWTMAILALLFTCTWLAVGALIAGKNTDELHYRSLVIAEILENEAQAGGEVAVLKRVRADAAMRANSCLELWDGQGKLLYADPNHGLRAMTSHTQSRDFEVPAPGLAGNVLKARYTVDFVHDRVMGRSWAVILMVITLAAGLLVWTATRWRVREQLRPLNDLAAQTRAFAPNRLDQRLTLQDPAAELLPWIEQFNALMGRLERAYAQLEGFNADVAHELRTPLATLMGQTEVALSRERSPEALRDTLTSNLEELQRLSALVNDMLFLSQADRGAQARRGAPTSLAGVAAQVVEFHEATLEEAGLAVQIQGDAMASVDEPLIKRALSNLMGNAVRFAKPNSTVVVEIAAAIGDQPVQVAVRNQGPAIEAADVPRLFDRFFRGDASRCCDDQVQHYGLGLSIVAAIARMHGGTPYARSHEGETRVGFFLVEGAEASAA